MNAALYIARVCDDQVHAANGVFVQRFHVVGQRGQQGFLPVGQQRLVVVVFLGYPPHIFYYAFSSATIGRLQEQNKVNAILATRVGINADIYLKARHLAFKIKTLTFTGFYGF